MQRTKLKQKYYVYTLAYPDGTVFYVGKGASLGTPRLAAHLWEAQKGVQSAKCDVIRTIHANGEEVLFTIIAEYEQESDAFAHESAPIKHYGSLLTNVNRMGLYRSPAKSGLTPFGIVLDHICYTLHIDWQIIAEHSNIDISTISRGTTGKRNLRYDSVMEICTTLRQFTGYQPEWEQALLNAAGHTTDTQIRDAMKLVLSSGKTRATRQELPFE
jgi:hypothetical protein